MMKKIANCKLLIVNSSESGQMLVVLLLVMVVGLTIGLFTLGRTTADISITTNVADSTRAFNAAEAGIEDAIRSIPAVQGIPVPVASGTSYTVNIASLGGTGATIFPSVRQPPVRLDDTFTLWLAAHDDTTGFLDETNSYQNNNIDLCFTTNTTVPALGVTLFYRDTATGQVKTAYTVYDQVNNRTADSQGVANNLSPCPTDAASGGPYDYHVSLQFNNDFGVNPAPGQNKILLSLRIKPLYAATTIAVIPQINQVLPKQGNNISATGTAGETARKIQVQKPYTVPAPFLDHVLYTMNGGLSK